MIADVAAAERAERAETELDLFINKRSKAKAQANKVEEALVRPEETEGGRG